MMMKPTDAANFVNNKWDMKTKPVTQSAQDMSKNWRKLKEILASSQPNSDAKSGQKIKNPHSIKGKILKKNKKKKTLQKVDSKSLIVPQTKNALESQMLAVSASSSSQTTNKLSYASVVNGTTEKQSSLAKESLPTVAENFNGSVKANPNLTKCLAIDCEFVGVGPEGADDMLARVSIVNQTGVCVYDKFVKPQEPIVNYRTAISGVRREDVQNGTEFRVVQKEVSDMLTDRILIGHSVHHDLKVLFLSHPRHKIRDTFHYKPFRALCNSGAPSLKKLASQILGIEIQQGAHDSVIDAQVAMQLYRLHRKEWEFCLKRYQRNQR